MTTKEMKEEIIRLRSQVAAGQSKETVEVTTFVKPDGSKVKVLSFRGGRAGWKGMTFGPQKAKLILDHVARIQEYVKSL